MRLDDVRGFVFDVDGTLVQRFADGVHPLPGALEVLEAIRASGRPLACSPTAATCRPRASPTQLREVGLPVADEEMVTPVRSALSYLRRRHRGRARAAVRATPSVRGCCERRASTCRATTRADVVLVLHADEIDFDDDRARRPRGARRRAAC